MSEEFDSYVRDRGDYLLRLAFMLTADAHLAEDLVQEVLTRTHRRWPAVIASGQPDQYMRKVMISQFLSWRRKLSFWERPAEISLDDAVPRDHANEHAERDAMWALLRRLPRKQRAVLVLRFYEDIDDATIAELMDCAQVTVRAQVSKALARLRTIVAKSSSPGVDS